MLLNFEITLASQCSVLAVVKGKRSDPMLLLSANLCEGRRFFFHGRVVFTSWEYLSHSKILHAIHVILVFRPAKYFNKSKS